MEFSKNSFFHLSLKYRLVITLLLICNQFSSWFHRWLSQASIFIVVTIYFWRIFCYKWVDFECRKCRDCSQFILVFVKMRRSSRRLSLLSVFFSSVLEVLLQTFLQRLNLFPLILTVVVHYFVLSLAASHIVKLTNPWQRYVASRRLLFRDLFLINFLVLLCISFVFVFLRLNWWHVERVICWVHLIRLFRLLRLLLFQGWSKRMRVVVVVFCLCVGCSLGRIVAPTEQSVAVSRSIVGRRSVHLGAIGVKVLIVERNNIWCPKRLPIAALSSSLLHLLHLSHLLLKLLSTQCFEVTYSH